MLPSYLGSIAILLAISSTSVAIVLVLPKILERAVFVQIMDFMTGKDLINVNYNPYRPRHNTTALIQMYDSWIEMMESGNLGGICMLDMSAAFDVVDHGLLLKKLSLYGFENSAIMWVKDYLGGRSQCVAIDGVNSDFLDCIFGVPQGSILGPLFYTSYTNDMPEVINENTDAQLVNKDSNVCCYADDTTLSCSASDPASLSKKTIRKIQTFIRLHA